LGSTSAIAVSTGASCGTASARSRSRPSYRWVSRSTPGCARWTLARAHAQSADRIAFGACLGKGKSFDRAIADFSEPYADQNERDHAALADAAKSGRIEARTDLL
jgi:uncharacterized protein DUF2252